MLKYKTLMYKYKYKPSHFKPNWTRRSILLAYAGSNLCAQLHCKRLYKDIKHCWVLYETYVEFSVSEGVLISTATRKLFYPYKSFVTFWDRKDWYSSSSQKSTMTASPSLPPLWCSLSRSYPKVFMQRHGQYGEICRLWHVFPAKIR